jgi:proteic killer suppression protein
MIRSWRNAASRKIWEGERPGQFRGLDFDVAIDLLLALNVGKDAARPEPAQECWAAQAQGGRKGQWAMTVNARWRICFEFRKSDAFEVEIVDYDRG